MDRPALPNENLFDHSTMTFGEHLEELRRSLARALIWLAIGCLIALVFISKPVVRLIQAPLQAAIIQYQADRSLAQLGFDPEENTPEVQGLRDWMLEHQMAWELVYVLPGETMQLLAEAGADLAPQDAPASAAEQAAPPRPTAGTSRPEPASGPATPPAAHDSESDAPEADPAESNAAEPDTAEPELTESASPEAAAEAANADAEEAAATTAAQDPAPEDALGEDALGADAPGGDAPAEDAAAEAGAAERTVLSKPARPAVPVDAAKPQDVTAEQAAADLLVSEEVDVEPPSPETVATSPLPLDEVLNRVPAPSEFVPQLQLKRTQAALNSHQVEEPFMIYIKASVVVGAVIASPMIFYYLWGFVAAGLYPHERKYVYMYLPFSVTLFISGVCLAFFAVLRYVLDFLLDFNSALSVDMEPRLSYYVSFVLLLPLGFGVAFQLPLVMLFLQRIGIFETSAYENSWRMAVLVIALLSMILTPADPYSMVLLMVPMVALYFLGIGLCRFMPRGRGLGEAAYDPR